VITWGISAGSHDAAISVLQDDQLVFAAHSERYSKIKNDKLLHRGLVQDALKHGQPDQLVWHEKPWLRWLRELRSGEWQDGFSRTPRVHLRPFGLDDRPLHTVRHHESHAAAGYFTSGFSSAAIIVIDAIGEMDTVSVWQGIGDRIKCIKRASYPNSLGLFYSAMTQRCGFKPNEEEYIMMGLAAYGKQEVYRQDILDDLIEIIDEWPFFRTRFNQHRGVLSWRPDLDPITDSANLAAATQRIYSEVLKRLSEWAYTSLKESNLVLAGGCALNCVGNTVLARSKLWQKIWIMLNPGDAGNSLGAALAHNKKHITWTGPYLGQNISGKYPVESALRELLQGRVVGVANGRAEFGPRALGNRSLLADPRLPDIKDRMNEVKQREEFRPFAPVIMAEHAHRYFEDIGQDMSYMQYAVRCLKPKRFPGIVHVDGTSRVQTVSREQNQGLYDLLAAWYRETGCPMLVNTSLNIKGQPLVNDITDALTFERRYGIRVFF
jgi:carbamoyltransferase